MFKKWLGLTLKVSVSGALIWFVLSKIDLSSAKDRALDVAPEMLLFATMLFLVQAVIAGARWKVVLSAIGAPLPFIDSFKIYYIGLFFNQTLPSSVGGDAVRMYIAKRAGVPLGASINSVLLERGALVIALVLIVTAMQPYFMTRVPDDQEGLILTSVAVLFVLMVVGLIVLMNLDRLPSRYSHWRVVRGLAMLASDSRLVFLSPQWASKILAWSLVGHVNVTLSIYILALGLKLDVSMLDCLALFPPVMLATTLPISIAGWGVREGAMVAAFGLIGVSQEGAVVLSLLAGILAIVASLPGGIIWLMSGYRRKDIETETAAVEADS
ncbi:MAG: flippase-like domain-containing protein [Rhodospirillaceae bacterium]|jgi:glycosyltransferase 2 family protein|nr:flippase-like domain-containing protein [Rhodospirillales bacterium]MBT3907802.1 flippase-like domain-containing protein [Rhodospirillaceae bacterium]MBT4701299.1 flippase-like domain-containing protein [Rhodospirillaceae bacterium]MBT5035763.1 flippase-like domain-containing protein [Rhodospirillaceae bacterium]MBT6218766.1 flippase-like domain-containing protein [Rhodospirillaceae bacterium]